jgi:hypothetical protein
MPSRHLRLAVCIAATGCTLHGTVESESFCFGSTTYSQVMVRNDSGDVSVVSGSRTRVDAEIRYTGGRRPELGVRVVGDTLTIEHDCPPGFGICAVDYTITIPGDKDLAIDGVSGNVEVAGMVSSLDVAVVSGNVDVSDHGGRIDIDLESGNADLADVTGDVHAWVTSGNIDARGLDAGEITAAVESGNATVSVVSVPGSVIMESTSGNLELEVPRGEYDMRLRAVSGSISVNGVSDSDASPSRIDLSTTSGDISVTGL